MGKPSGGTSGGGTSGGSIFTTNITGSGSVGSSLYIDLGLIPTGKRAWLGNTQFASPDKSCTFSIRKNNSTKSAGTDADTTQMTSSAAGPTTGTVTTDYYKNGTLHTVSNISTGVEHWWLKIVAKSATVGSYYNSINYTLE